MQNNDLISRKALIEAFRGLQSAALDEWSTFGVVAQIENAPTVNAVVSPCKVGDAVWVVFTPKYPANPADKGKWFMVEDGVQRIICGVKGISIETWNFGTIPEKEIGKKLFFSREEAESALAERVKKYVH